MMRARRMAVALTSLAAVATGMTAFLRRQRHRRSDYRVYILEYHNVTKGRAEREGAISVTRFLRHLRYLKRRFSLESLSRAAELLSEPRALTEDRVVVTFDDGYAENYELAWPILRQERIPVTLFLTTGFLDGSELWFDFAGRSLEAAGGLGAALPDEVRQALVNALGRWPPGHPLDRCIEQLKYLPLETREQLLRRLRDARLPLAPAARPLSWQQVREMHADGVEIGGHTVAHPILSMLSAAQQEGEIVGSRNRIAEEIGATPTTFAFPNGSDRDFDPTTLEHLRAAGFMSACTTVRGSNAPGCDPLTLRRIGVGSDSNFVLATRLSGLFDQEARGWLRGRWTRR